MSLYGTCNNIEEMLLEEIQDALESFEFEMLTNMSAEDRKALESSTKSPLSFIEWLDRYFAIHGTSEYKRLLEERKVRGVYGPDDPLTIQRVKHRPVDLHAAIYGYIASRQAE